MEWPRGLAQIKWSFSTSNYELRSIYQRFARVSQFSLPSFIIYHTFYHISTSFTTLKRFKIDKLENNANRKLNSSSSPWRKQKNQ